MRVNRMPMAGFGGLKPLEGRGAASACMFGVPPESGWEMATWPAGSAGG